jgi:hypothetical protein
MQYIDLKCVGIKSRQSRIAASAVLLLSHQNVRVKGHASYPSLTFTKVKHTPIRHRKVMRLNSTIRKGTPVLYYAVSRYSFQRNVLIIRTTINKTHRHYHVQHTKTTTHLSGR